MKQSRFVGVFVAAATLVIFLGCASFERTSLRLDRERERAGEAEYARTICAGESLAGNVSGVELGLQASYESLKSLKIEASFEQYRRLAQQLASYTAEWEFINQSYKMACQQNAICRYRESDLSACADEHANYESHLDRMNDFVLRLRAAAREPQ